MVGQVLVFVFELPSKKSSLQNIFGSNLQLHAREARGNYANQWFSLFCAKESLGKIDPSLILEPKAGIEPATYSFAYTSFYFIHFKEG